MNTSAEESDFSGKHELGMFSVPEKGSFQAFFEIEIVTLENVHDMTSAEIGISVIELSADDIPICETRLLVHISNPIDFGVVALTGAGIYGGCVGTRLLNHSILSLAQNYKNSKSKNKAAGHLERMKSVLSEFVAQKNIHKAELQKYLTKCIKPAGLGILKGKSNSDDDQDNED